MKLLCNLYVRCGLVNNYIWPLYIWPGIHWHILTIFTWHFEMKICPTTEDSGCLVHKSNLYMSCQLLFVNDFEAGKLCQNVGHPCEKWAILLDQPVTKQLQKPHEGIIPIYIG